MADDYLLRITLEPSNHAPRLARHALRAWLSTVACADGIRDDLLVVCSELITNSVTHARSRSEITATFDHGRIRVEVCDDDPNPPTLAAEGHSSEGGFGLRFVDRLTDGWGWHPTDTGKRVWVETLC